MYLSRFIREAEDEGESYVWYPPKGQIGTPWLNLAEDSTEDNLSLYRINVLFILFAIQTAFAVLGVLSSLCNKDENVNNKQKA